MNDDGPIADGRPGRVRFAVSGPGIMGWVAQAEVDPDRAPGLFQAWVDGGTWDLPKLGIGERFVVRRTLAPGWAIIPLWRTTWPPKPAPKDGAP